MNNIARLFGVIILGGCIYYIALHLIPSLGLFEDLLRTSPISKGDITQVTYLVSALLLILTLGGGSFSAYGFKFITFREIVRPILIAIPTGLFVIVLNVITVISMGPNNDFGENPALGESFLKIVISIWLIASTCEEVFFRGFVQGFLDPLKKYGITLIRARVSVPVMVSAVGFGLGHLCLLGNMNSRIVVNIVIATMFLGFIAGYYREKTGSLIPAIAVHMTFNIVGYGIPAIMMKMAGM